jgi:hypothetical protein
MLPSPKPASALPVLLALLAAAPLLVRPAAADTVVLEDGTRLDGKVVLAEQQGPVKLQLPDGTVRTVARSRVETLLRDEPEGRYVRLARYRDGWSRLEVASVTLLHRESGSQVSLVGAVHIGDMDYYHELQRLLDDHDVVLFEGVGADSSEDLTRMVLPGADERARQLKARPRGLPAPPAEGYSLDPLTGLQTFMGNILELDFQKDGISYQRSWWKPADVTGEELMALLGEQDFGPMSLLRQSADARAQAQVEGAMRTALGELASSLVTGKPLRVILKETFAEVLTAQMSGLSSNTAPEQPEQEPAPRELDPFNAAIILGRNDVAERKIGEALTVKGARRIALFYGAGHMPDLEARLHRKGFVRASERWLGAWDMTWEPKSFWERFGEGR